MILKQITISSSHKKEGLKLDCLQYNVIMKKQTC